MTTDTNALQAQITAFWNTRGQEYDQQPRHGILHAREHQAWLDILKPLFPPAPAEVLDVGCGTGVLSVLLAELGHRVTGTDLAEGMLATARQKAVGVNPAPVFQIGDAIEPSFPPASFDVVTNRHLLWTLLDPARAFANWLRLLRPGGRLVAIDSLWEQERHTRADEPPRPHPGYSEEAQAAMPLRGITSVEPVLEVARAAGFADVHVVHLEQITAIERELFPNRENGFSVRYAVIGHRAKA
jgi:SAM-dependent methyltransferase